MQQQLQEEIKQAVGDTVHGHVDYLQVWKQSIVFTWQWWLQLALLAVPIVIWVWFRKKSCTDRLLYAGLFVLLITSWFDFAGNSYGLWYYPYKVIPFLPPFVPFETFQTVEVLFLLQCKPKVSMWYKAAGLALVNSFVGEPLADWLGIYVRVHWEYIYSVPFYVIIYLISHYLCYKRTKFDELR